MARALELAAKLRASALKNAKNAVFLLEMKIWHSLKFEISEESQNEALSSQALGSA